MHKKSNSKIQFTHSTINIHVNFTLGQFFIPSNTSCPPKSLNILDKFPCNSLYKEQRGERYDPPLKNHPSNPGRRRKRERNERARTMLQVESSRSNFQYPPY